MFTTQQPITGTVYIWAIPCSRYEMEDEPTRFPFRYELHTSSPWQTGAVRVSEHQVTLTVPPGVNLLAAALETLEAKKKEAFDYYARQVAEIDEKIQQLMMITGPATTTQDGDSFIEGSSISVIEGESE